MSQIETERNPIRDKEEYFINNTEKDLHFNIFKNRIDEFKESVEERFNTHYRGEIKYDDLYSEINNMLDGGKQVTEVKNAIMEMENYKDILDEDDLFALLTEVVIKRAVDLEKKKYHYEDKEKDVAM